MRWAVVVGCLIYGVAISTQSGCGQAPGPQAVLDQIDFAIGRGDLAGADVKVDQALRTSHTTDWLWRFRIQKARILASRSNSSKAIALLNDNFPPSLATTDVAVLRYTIEGAAYRIAQDFGASGRALAAAEALAASSYQELLPKVLIEKGSLNTDQRNFAVADETYHRALFLARRQHNREQEAAALVNLARLAMRQSRLDEAVDQNVTALGFSRTLGKETFVATALGNLGVTYFELGDFDNSFEFYKQAVDASDRTGLSAYKLYWFTGIVNSYLAVHDYQAAESLAASTLASARTLKNTQTITECLNDLARITLRTNRIADAERYNREALGTPDKLGQLDSLLLAAEIAAVQKRFDDADHFFRQVLAEPTAETQLRWEAQAGLAGVRDGEAKPAEAEQQYKQAIHTIENARQSINHEELRLSFLSSGMDVYGEYIDFLIRHGRPDDALRQADLSRARTLAEGLSASRVAASRPAVRLKPQELAKRLRATLLVYWLGEKHSYLWAITPSKTQYFTLPPASEIDPLVKSYRDLTLKSTDLLASATDAGEKLYSALVAPAKKLIPAGSRVILLPDASLYGLNFETLIVPNPNPRFWIEDATLTTASSLSVLDRAANRSSAKQKNLLLVGDAVPVPEFGELPQAPVEIQKLGQYFPGKRRTVLQGPQATPKAYLDSRPDRFSYIHFVTHGTASRARPLESAVILGKEPDSESYKLYAREIVAHRLHADLVTISACNGSGTRAYSGEGLVGLSWAFLRAGAHNVVGALWEVSDVSTPQLMDKMYAELAAGKDPATALRNAKLAFLRQHNVFAKPFYWAPFQLYAGS